jgi:hypothetical protein
VRTITILALPIRIEMSPRLQIRFLVGLGVVLTAIAAFDVANDLNWDAFWVLVGAGVIQLLAIAALGGARRSVPIRADLVRWLEHRSESTGESVHRIADRGLATYRASLEMPSDPELRDTTV